MDPNGHRFPGGGGICGLAASYGTDHSGVFTLAVGLLGVAVVVAVGTKGRNRLAWLSFVVFGGLYSVLSFGPSSGLRTPPFLPTTLMKMCLGHLNSQLSPDSLSSPVVTYAISSPQPTTFVIDSSFNNPASIPFTDYLSFNFQNSSATGVPNREPFYQVGHSLATLLIGFMAAVVTLVVTALRRDEARS